MLTTKGPAPGFEEHPEHRVQHLSSQLRYLARAGEALLADCSRVWIVEETDLESVVYFHPDDVNFEHLQLIDQHTECPFKGDAHYFVLTQAPEAGAAAWSYGEVYDESAEIKGYIAFYRDRVETEAI